jgi:hypothetical protein
LGSRNDHRRNPFEGDTRYRPSPQVDSFIAFSSSFTFYRHLGDACNELGQTLFRTMSTAPITCTQEISKEDTLDSILINVYDRFQQEIVSIADTVSVCYSSAMELFSSISPHSKSTLSANLIAIRCNLSCLKRSLASSLSDLITNSFKQNGNEKLFQTISSPLLVPPFASRKSGKQHQKFLTPLEYIFQAIEICQDSILDIDSSQNLQLTGASSILSLELATNYTFAGYSMKLTVLVTYFL